MRDIDSAAVIACGVVGLEVVVATKRTGCALLVAVDLRGIEGTLLLNTIHNIGTSSTRIQGQDN